MSAEPIEATDELIDQVVEWLGMKCRKSHIKAKLREIYPEVNLPTIEKLITLAKKRIIEIFHCDPQEFKGSAVEFYSSIIRDVEVPIKFRIVAQTRLDSLLGLEQVTSDDPQEYASKVQDALREMDGSLANK